MKKRFILLTLIITATTLLVSCGECEHEFDSWEVVEESTCTQKGLRSRSCEKCGYEETKTIKAGSHNEVADQKIEATCTENGLTEGSHCSICNAVMIEQMTIDATGHDYESTLISEPSCAGDGETSYTCKNCNDTYTEKLPMPIYSADDIYNKLEGSIGEIITYDTKGNELALGTGFVYTNDGWIITNYHVIEDAKSAKITISEKTYQIDRVLAYDKNIDLAVLKIDAADLAPVTICQKEHAVGKTVYAIGSSRGMTATFSQGIITHTLREIDNITYVQHDAAISGGNSGGPLVNQYGEVIGINTWTMRDSQNLNFAITTSELNNLDYSKSLSFEEFYEKEGDVILKLKNYILTNGSYDPEWGDYYLHYHTAYSSDYSSTYYYYTYYVPNTNTIEFYMFIDSGETVWMDVDVVDGYYDWGYYDDSDYEMKGEIIAATYGENTLVGYNYNNIYNTSLRNSVRKLASAMLLDMFYEMEAILAPKVGITMQALGFLAL